MTKFLPLIWAGLWRKRTRTILTFLSIVVAFVLFGILQTMDATFDHMLASQHLDRLLVIPRYSLPLPAHYLDQIKAVSGVTSAAPIANTNGYFQDQKNRVRIIMTNEDYFGVYSEYTISKNQIEALRKTRTGAIISIAQANEYGWKVGDKIPLTLPNMPQLAGGTVWTFDILAIVDIADADPGTVPFFIGNYEYLDNARRTDAGTVGRFAIRIDSPDQSAQVGRAIDRLFINSSAPTRTMSEKALAQSKTDNTVDIKFFTKAVIGAVFFTLLFLTANTMVQSVRERTSEFAIFKTIGFSDPGIALLILLESMLLCAAGALGGFAIARGLIPITGGITGIRDLPPIVLLHGAAAALLVGFISGLMPVWSALRLDVVTALSGRADE